MINFFLRYSESKTNQSYPVKWGNFDCTWGNFNMNKVNITILNKLSFLWHLFCFGMKNMWGNA